jgi:hypothetical protein
LATLQFIQPEYYPCPRCNDAQPECHGYLFQGIHILADCTCQQCATDYFHSLPVAHDKHFPIAFSKDGKVETFDEKARHWLARPLIQSILDSKTLEISIQRTIKNPHQDVILLNCLDFCYGHVLLKLANAQKYLEQFPDKGLIVLIPSSFEWLVPDGVAEVWSINARLSQLLSFLPTLDTFVHATLPEYQSFRISPVPIHPDSMQIDWEKFLRTSRFQLHRFSDTAPCISFIYREDRLWLNKKTDNLLWKLLSKTGLRPYVKRYFLTLQNKRFAQIARRVQKVLPDATFLLIGLGQTASCPQPLQDKRKTALSSQDEWEWCRLYAQSHLVVGMHGSNMLIPTALAGGFIELLPEYKIVHLTEDIVQVYPNRYAQFLGRYLDEYSSARMIAKHITTLFDTFQFYRNTTEEKIKEGI